jgi:predicted ATPase/transcriptional regulator with GAF, ATPase, and Fis domain
MIIPGYLVTSEVCRSRSYVLWRGQTVPGSERVLVKSVLVVGDAGAAARLNHEFGLFQALEAPGVARARELLPGDHPPALVLEDPGGECFATRLLAGPLPLADALRVGVQLADVLAALHDRRITHQAIQPAHLLYDEASPHVTLVDLGTATRLPFAPSAPRLSPDGMEALAYASPEQTGRMNRDVDYRTDFYSLGVLLYQALTGRLPFESDDPLELVHAHIARLPAAPAELDPAIPGPVSAVVMKLLAKTAEARYQSARGLRSDLGRCLAEWERTGAVAAFVPGSGDVSDRFIVPQHLYGREVEVRSLLAAFDRAATGGVELLLVAGYAGIGKTALVQELYRPIVRHRGRFVAGKFDQVVRLPYGGLLQAFRALLQQLLTGDEAELGRWRERLTAMLGTGASVLAQVLPEAVAILGPQPPPAAVEAAEAQHRFRLVFERFLRAVADAEHPLVVFLDDLQWADASTLDLLRPLATSPELSHVLLIGAYRDNEVDPGHPLARALRTLDASGVSRTLLELGALTLSDLVTLAADSLRVRAAQAEPLAELLERNTGGNPFFVIQFLKALHEQELIRFDAARRCWDYRLEDVEAAGLTDNVVELMTRKIHRLAPATQAALTLAACIGNRFDLGTLAAVGQRTEEATATDLAEALAEGLVLPDRTDSQGAGEGTGFVFLHDRVQQAAYGLIDEERKPVVHLAIGRLLLECWPDEVPHDLLFDLLHHLDLGRFLVTDAAERLRLARLNLAAARRAKTSTAYGAAAAYASAGLDLLGDGAWQNRYELMLDLQLEAAEAEHLAGAADEAARRFEWVLPHLRTRLDRARLYALRIVQLENLSRYADAIRLGLDALEMFGVCFPDSDEARAAELERDLDWIFGRLGDREVSSLLELPEMHDPEQRAVMRLLATVHMSGYLSGDKPFTLLNTATLVRLSLTHGNSQESAYGYVLFGMLLALARGRFAEAYEFATLGLRLNERLPEPSLRARSLKDFSWAVSPWRRPLEESIPVCHETFRIASEVGLFTEAAWALFNENWIALLVTDDLTAFADQCRHNLEATRRLRMQHIAEGGEPILQWARALQGLTRTRASLSDDAFDEDAYLRAQAGNDLNRMFFHVARLAVLFAFEEYEAACATARESVYIPRHFTGNIWDEQRTFYYALSLAAMGREGEGEETLDSLHARLARWAESAPQNYAPQEHLVRAEIARLRGHLDDAAEAYEQAISLAAEYHRTREHALANELYARFWLSRGQLRAAAAFLREARRLYSAWGARGKAAMLDERYADLLSAVPDGRAESTATPAAVAAPLGAGTPEAASVSDSALDLASVMKAARAISGELELEPLLAALVRIAVENAGAERGALVLERAGDAFVRATGTRDRVEVTADGVLPLAETAALPVSIVHYVRRSGEPLVLADAGADDRFARDDYIRRERPRSVLCTPVHDRARRLGVLYLENSLATGAFTEQRIEVLRLLAAQAATAIVNAELFVEVSRLRDRLQAENVYLQEEIRTQHNFEEIIGRSPALERVLRQVEQVAPTDATVLITGETGTGKELIARAIHNHSPRRGHTLVTVNCGAISAGLVESELFGHERGAFTGALQRKIGRFELADGGTIFLDEIGDLPLDLQVKLLRVLQEGEIERVGGGRTIPVNVRVIAATHRDLAAAVAAGTFRSDLFYRLDVFPIHIPPLRERPEDIPLLVRYFVAQCGLKMGKRIEAIPRHVLDALTGYGWPGNIRELRNVIERSVIISTGSTLQLGEWLPASYPVVVAADSAAGAVGQTLEEVERRYIVTVLERTGWRVSGERGAARVLGLKPTTLEARMKKLHVFRPQ